MCHENVSESAVTVLDIFQLAIICIGSGRVGGTKTLRATYSFTRKLRCGPAAGKLSQRLPTQLPMNNPNPKHGTGFLAGQDSRSLAAWGTIACHAHRLNWTMPGDDAFFFDFLPGSKAISEFSRYFMERLRLLSDRAATLFYHLLDKIDGYLGRVGHSQSAPLPFLALLQDPMTFKRLYAWVSQNKVLVAVILVESEAIVISVIVKYNAREIECKRRAKRFANGQRKEVVGM
jgi:hypothetical protein